MIKVSIMKKIIFGVVLALMAIFIFLNYSNTSPKDVSVLDNVVPVESDDIAVVKSDDDQASLKISKDSLPDGVSLSDISIELQQVEQTESYKTIALYKLSPDGLKLSKPAEFTYTYDRLDDDALPQAFHYYKADEGGYEMKPLINFKADIDLNTKKVIISGEVNSFSYLSIGHSAYFISFYGSSPMYGEKEFTMTGSIIARKDSAFEIFSNEDTAKWIFYKNKYNVEGLMRVDKGRDIVVPGDIRDVPKEDQYHAGTKMVFNKTFTCLKKGKVELSYRIDLIQFYTVKWLSNSFLGVRMKLFQSDENKVSRYVYVLRENITCPSGLETKKESVGTSSEFFCGDGVLGEGEKCIYDQDPPRYNKCINPESKNYGENSYEVGSTCLLSRGSSEKGVCLKDGTCWLGVEKKSRIVVIDKVVDVNSPVLIYIYDPGRKKFILDAFVKEIKDGLDYYRSNFCSTNYLCKERVSQDSNLIGSNEKDWEGYAFGSDPGPIQKVTDFSDWFENEPSEEDKPYWFKTTNKIKYRRPYLGFENPGTYKLEIINTRGVRVESEPFYVCINRLCK